MRLHPDWKQIVLKAWSVKFMCLAAILSGIEAILPLFEMSFPPLVFAGLFGLTTAAALVSRVIAQRDFET